MIEIKWIFSLFQYFSLRDGKAGGGRKTSSGDSYRTGL